MVQQTAAITSQSRERWGGLEGGLRVRRLKPRAIIHGVIAFFLDFNLLVRATGIWCGVLMVAGLLARMLLVTKIGPQDPAAHNGLIISQVMFPFVAIMAFALAGCAVNVHRFILLRERPVPVRVSRTEWRYFLRAIRVALPVIFAFVALAFIAAAIVVSLQPEWSPQSWNPASPLIRTIEEVGIGLLSALLLVPRSLALPAAAIGRRDFGVHESKQIARGNILGLALLYSAGLIATIALRRTDDALAYGLSFVAPQASVLIMVGQTIAGSIISIIETVLWAATLSLAYAGLVEGRSEFAE